MVKPMDAEMHAAIAANASRFGIEGATGIYEISFIFDMERNPRIGTPGYTPPRCDKVYGQTAPGSEGPHPVCFETARTRRLSSSGTDGELEENRRGWERASRAESDPEMLGLLQRDLPRNLAPITILLLSWGVLFMIVRRRVPLARRVGLVVILITGQLVTVLLSISFLHASDFHHQNVVARVGAESAWGRFLTEPPSPANRQLSSDDAWFIYGIVDSSTDVATATTVVIEIVLIGLFLALGLYRANWRRAGRVEGSET